MTEPKWIRRLRFNLSRLGLFKGHLHYYTTVASTQSEAARLASKGAEEGTLVVAGKQLEGKGRCGRRWRSDAGGLWMSLVLKPKSLTGGSHLITLLASLSVVRSLDRFSFDDVSIEWPNDVLIGVSKVAGLLSEAVFVGSELEYIVLGIGINVNNPIEGFQSDFMRNATSLRESSGSISKLDEVAYTVLGNLEGVYLEAQRHGLVKLISDVKGRTSTIGKDIVLTIGGKELHVKAVDLLPDGRLVVKGEKSDSQNILPEDIERLRRG
ncbi:MAG: biotin--[acetyl-CoA-carboxylase] ligase [Thaumarchaeota archaeon]|nr:biotin--[acetyl-CoA-carboxylase] ligase [Nitrososphaerota archaeon]